MRNGGKGRDFGDELLSTSIKRLLLERIMSGHYQPGERIIELQVAKELGTSQSPIREALRDLAGVGIVTITSRRGARVRMPTGKDLADVSVVRAQIDSLAAELAAPRMTDKSLGELQDAYEEMCRHLDHGDHAAMTEADARFHRIIATRSDNQAVERVFDQLEPFARTFLTLTLPNLDVRSLIDEHKGILDALRHGDAQTASLRARLHQLDVSALFRDHYPPQADADGGAA